MGTYTYEHYEPNWTIGNNEIIKIRGAYVKLPKNIFHTHTSLVMRRNGKVYCNGHVWNYKQLKWSWSIKAFWYYIFDRRKHE